ncbi:translational activator of GCN4 [Physocladia obscura]|uniref:eIF-2-alpha kinase activator GCN1 n=1 Tax=Physocladia obscura TaxID=109957 RepID=A0AAD5T7S6_9FUNG|nr:translational activator of GCN4 [Physocladia obscura]
MNSKDNYSESSNSEEYDPEKTRVLEARESPESLNHDDDDALVAHLGWPQFATAAAVLPPRKSLQLIRSKLMLLAAETSHVLVPEAVPDANATTVLAKVLLSHTIISTSSPDLLRLGLECARLLGKNAPDRVPIAFASLLERESRNAGTQTLTLFTLLKWTSAILCLLIPRGFGSNIDLNAFSSLLSTHASVLDALFKSFSVSTAKNARLIGQAIRLTRRFMLQGKPAFMASKVLVTILSNEKIVDASAPDSFKWPIIIGSAISCILHKKWSDDSAIDAKRIASFYEKNVIANCSKGAIQPIVLESFDLFFQKYLNLEMLETQLCVSAERLMLRSPEFVIRIYQKIITSIEFDISKLFREKFLDSLLNNMKSLNEAVRIDAANLFRAFAEKSSNIDELAKILDLVLKSFTAKSPTPEARALYFSVLATFPTPNASIASKIIATLISLSQKETSENGLIACYASISTASKAFILTNDNTTILPLFTFILGSLSDAKSTLVRRSALTLLKHIGYDILANNVPEKILAQILEAVIKVLDKVQAHGITLMVDTGTKKENPVLVEGYLAFGFLLHFLLWERSNATEIGVAKILESKKTLLNYISQPPAKSFLLNEKYYLKLLTSYQDQKAFLDVLSLLLESDFLFSLLPLGSHADTAPFSNAWAYIMVSQTVNHTIRKEALDFIQSLVSRGPGLLRRAATVGRPGLCAVLKKSNAVVRPNPSVLEIGASPETSSAWGDEAQKIAQEHATRLFNAIQSFVPRNISATVHESDALKTVLRDFLIACSHPVIAAGPGVDAWIRVCWRAGVNPVDISTTNAATLLEKWMKNSQNADDATLGGFGTNISPGFVQATKNAIALLVGVTPEVVMTAAMPQVLATLDNSMVESVSVLDVEIWKGVEGVAVCDNNGRLKVVPSEKEEDDKRLTAEEKWERDLKRELLAKKGSTTTTTPKSAAGGKASVAAGKPLNAKAVAAAKAEKEAERLQLDKEASNRKRVEAIKIQVLVGLNVLEAVLNGVVATLDLQAREAFEMWMSRTIEAIIKVVVRESVVIRRGKRGKRGPVLIGKKVIDVFRLISKATDDRIWRIVEMGWDIATLRILGVEVSADGVPEDQCQKELPVVLTKLLMTAKTEYVASDPLSAGAFAYIFPLIQTLILQNGRSRNIHEKIRTELIIFGSEILIAHCGLGGSPLVPRKSMVNALIEILNTMPRLHGAAREGLLTLCVSLEDAAANEDDAEDNLNESEKLLKQMRVSDEADITNELLNALLSPEPLARQSALKALQHLQRPAGASDGVAAARVWQAKFDTDEIISAEAGRVWEIWNSEETLGVNGIQGVIELICRIAAGKSLNAALEFLDEEVENVLKEIFSIYEIKNILPVPEYDDFGIVIPASLHKKDEWPSRSGIALALQACAPVLKSEALLNLLFEFLIKKEALGDREESVRLQMLEAGIAAANTDTGKSFVNVLLKTFSDYLSSPAGSSKSHDLIRESAVILLGTVAQHLDASDRKIPDVVDRLVETLKTPSEVVQIAVSECMPPLIKTMSGDQTRELFDRLLRLLFASAKYAERRGAAYGIAGAVKGKGIGSLKEFGIINSLKEAIEDKKKYERREGALFAFETLSVTLGRLFEPYVIQILPLLLVCYGDSQREVREATNYTCKAIMSKLSGHCVKLVMPSLLNGLDDKAWRTKTGSIEALGSMAALAPKQLSLSLPTIIPRLCEVLADTHIKVQDSAKQALNSFGSVIKNPEIQELVPELLAALIDPNENTQAALTALLETSFVHYIDSPSLALIVPILQRGLIERVTETKKKAAQIMGQMATLTDQKDLIPYLEILLPGLKEVLVDPVPEARAISAQALGSMFSKLGESNFPDLVSELLETLKSETSAVDRAGAAQGLSEILNGAGLERLESLMPEILNYAMSPRTYVREGFITLLVFLPATFGSSFQPYIGGIIPPILRGLADETDSVRETSMKAGRVIVRNYATTAVNVLLPELETGLFDENWRIRQSSIQLMGDLLYRIAGVSGKIDVEGNEDDSIGTEHNKKALISTLGQERYDSVLSALYIVRSDTNGIVRSAALHVWKSIVSNTPRTLKEILPVIIQMVIESLADENFEKRGVAARTLGDLVRKLGDIVLNELVPVLESGLKSEIASTREGACIGMSEIMATAGKAQLVDFVVQCLPSIKKALMDSEPEVREAAAQTFDMLHQHMGAKAIDEVLPSLLNELKAGGTGSSAYALEALKELMSVRSNVVFPVLIPTLLATPITAFNARALASLISVAGSALNKRLSTILPVLMDGLDQGDHAVPDIRDALKVLLLSVDDDGLYTLMPILSGSVSEGSPSRVKAACDAFMIFCEGSKVDVSEFAIEWFNRLLEMLQGAPKYASDLVQSAWSAIDALAKRVKKDDMERLVVPIRRAITSATERLGPNQELAGFCLPKGISPVLPFFLQGLMYGNSDVREESAKGLGDLVRRTSADGLKTFVTQITGPLIRIIGDRVAPGVKAAILNTLGLLLVKVPANLKPFLPQLQRTFIKSLSEPVLNVQTPARKCLTLLIGLQPRLDPLVAELTTGIKTAEEKSVRDAMWGALLGLLNGLEGKEITEVSKKTIETLLVEALFSSNENDDIVRKFAAKCLATYCKYISKEEVKTLLSSKILSKQILDDVTVSASTLYTKRHGLMESLFQLVKNIPAAITSFAPFMTVTVSKIFEGFESSKSVVLEATVLCTNHILVLEAQGLFSLEMDEKIELFNRLVGLSKEGLEVDARRIAVLGIKNLAKKHYQSVQPHLGLIVPTIMLLVRERVIPIKLAAERALLHLLRLTAQNPDPSVLIKYTAGLDNASARNTQDYAKRVLSKLAEKDSDDDDEEGDENDKF